MSPMSYYDPVSDPKRLHPFRGLWLRTRRFSMSRIRYRFSYFFRILQRWKFSYGKAVKFPKRGSILRRSIKDNNEENLKRKMVSSTADSSRSYGYYNNGNSFYSDAISDCLEYIKMSSNSNFANDDIDNSIVS